MHATIKSATRLLLGLVVAGAAAACGGDDSVGPSTPAPGGGNPPADISGAYALTQVRTLGHLGGGGTGLPVTFIDGSGDHLVFQSGAVTLAADGSFDMKVEVTFKGNPSQFTDYGTYSVSGSTIDFHSQKASPRLSTGTISGNKVTANSQFGGIPFEIDVER